MGCNTPQAGALNQAVQPESFFMQVNMKRIGILA